ncbi:MAG: mechanosensitive ion channel family protein [Prevotella micans]|nr:mechanosensitive ion channel family protein [Prevotella micans]
MNKRIFLLNLLLMFFILPAAAVLQEDSLQNSLAVLRHELITRHYEQTEQLNRAKLINERVMQLLHEIGENSAQISLMLYSQNSGNIFDLTYACHEATKLWSDFQEKTRPFQLMIMQSNEEIARYDSLINVLSTMYTTGMSEKTKTDRNVCLTLAKSIRRMLRENNDSYLEYTRYYDYSRQQVQSLDAYAQKRYKEFQSGIFLNRSDNYLKFLSQFRLNVLQLGITLSEKYTPQRLVSSQWDVMWLIGLFGMILMYGLIAVLVNYLSIRFLVTKFFKNEDSERSKAFRAKRTSIITVASIFTFGLILIIIPFFSESNFVNMASRLLLEFVWMLTVIFASLLLRIDGEHIRITYKIYYPIILIAFLVIAFRIVLIPETIVNLIFPAALLVTTIWQAKVIAKHRLRVPKYDLYLAYISQAIFTLALVSSWVGYILLSVQIVIWWVMQQACILTIACAHDYLAQYRDRHDLGSKPVSRTWFFRLCYFVMLPSAMVLSFILALYWAADVFNLSEMTWQVIRTNFINSPNLQISIFAIAAAIILWFVFKYLNNTIKDFIKLYLQSKDPTTAVSRSVMLINVVQVVVWGAWLLTVLNIFKVNNTWLVVVSGGLSTGIGFAMKDILENIYYGISLMAGRIKIGDYIICDGVRGRVTSINYTSTMLEALDGSVIAFQNSQLFTKNYKNMTKNHGYELDTLEVGVAYGTNIAQVKKLLEESIARLGFIYQGKKPKVVLRSFDDSCITLKVFVWVNVLTQSSDDSTIMECIYETLNSNGIEIPFPQREITIKHST